MSTKPRVLYFNEVSKMGGAEHSLNLLLQNLSNFEPHLVTGSKGELTDRLDKAGITYSLFNFPKLISKNPLTYFLNLFLIPLSIIKVTQLIRHIKPVILHTNTSRMHIIVSVVGRILRIPTVCHMRWIPIHSKLEVRFVSSFIKVFRPYTISISNIVSTTYHLDKYSKNQTISNGVICPQVNSDKVKTIRQQHNINNTSKVLLSIGRIEPWKGQLFVLHAVSLIKNKYPNIVLLIVGDESFSGEANYKEVLTNYVETHNLTRNVIFTGHVTNPYDYMATADIIYHSSITPEPFGRVVVEAMALKKPIIASSTGGPTEIIQNGYDGILCDFKDVQKVAEHTFHLLEDSQYYQQIVKNAFQSVCDKYTIDTHSKKIEDFYWQILDMRNHGK